jgi:translation initiation factor 2B subunit (eIF-2B alpha/beta/delta family)
MKAKFIERADRIAADNVSSAQQILKDMLDLLTEVSAESHTSLGLLQDVKSLSTAISTSQSQMSALSNVCKFILSASSAMKPDEVIAYLKDLRDKVEAIPSSVAFHASRHIVDGRAYATISQSEFVLKAFEKAFSENKRATVFVMESRPLYEGRQTAKALSKMGHRPILVSDASVGLFVEEIDAALVGADSILADGSLVNKVGSYPLALSCASAGKNFYAITSILKYDSRKRTTDFINKEESPDEIYANPEFSEKIHTVEVRNFYFDKVNPQLVTALITEVGDISPLSGLDGFDSRMQEVYSP